MKLFDSVKSRYKDFLLDHPVLKVILSYTFSVLGTVVAAFCIAYCYRSFVYPSAHIGDYSYNLVAGGVSGFGQVIQMAFKKIGIHLPITSEQLQSIIYLLVNTPLLLLAFFKIGKGFAMLSCVNILLTSLFITIIPEDLTTIFSIQDDLIARAIFAGVLNGIGVSIAVELKHSTGGTDIISTYFAIKKGVSIGKYVFFINGTIVLVYTILSSISTPASEGVPGAATTALYTLVFFFTSMIVIDTLSTRTKKVELQIVTSEPRLGKVLIQHFPHGCTIIDAKGAYYGTEKKVILTVISSFELKRAKELIFKIDPTAFVTVNNTYKVFGKFFIRPMK